MPELPGATLVSSQAWGKTLNMGLPEAAIMDTAATQVTPRPSSGPDYNPVVTLNGWTLPHRMNNGIKEFHLVAEPVERELADGMIAHLWGYNGQSTGPTIEAVEGDRGADLCHQQATGTHHSTLARVDPALRDGRRWRVKSSGHSTRQNLCL